LGQDPHSTARPGKSVLAGLLAVLILLVSAFSGDSSLHQRLHADPFHSGHNCALCLFLHGNIDSADVAAIKDSFVASLVSHQSVRESFEISLLDSRLSPARAPPHFSASRVG